MQNTEILIKSSFYLEVHVYRGEAAKLAYLLDSASLEKKYMNKNYEENMYWIAGYISYTFRWIKIALKIIETGVYAVNLPAMSGKLAQQYYNRLLPHISYFFLHI